MDEERERLGRKGEEKGREESLRVRGFYSHVIRPGSCGRKKILSKGGKRTRNWVENWNQPLGSQGEVKRKLS